MIRPNFLAAQTLLTVARLGTFTAAAERLNTTQSTISTRMRELERKLGFQLFVRQGRRLHLTLPARALIERIEPLMQELDEAFGEAGDATNPKGMVRLGLGEISISWFADLLPLLRRQLSNLQFSLEVDMSSVISEGLEAGRLDLGIVAHPVAAGDLRHRSLGVTSLRWYCTPWLAADEGGGPRDLGEMLRHELLWCLPRSSPFHAPVRDGLVELGADLDRLCDCTKLKGLLDLALAGAGLALLPEGMAKPHVEAGRLMLVSDRMRPHRLEFFLAVHRNQRQPVLRRIEDFLVEAARTTPL